MATVILLLLLALAIPVFISAKGSARQNACLSAARQNGTALLMYTHDFEGVYPFHDQSNLQEQDGKGRGGAVVEDWSSGSESNWAKSIASYTGHSGRDGILNCPDTEGIADNTAASEPPLSFIFNGWASGRAQFEAERLPGLVMLYDCRYQSSWGTANPSAKLPRVQGNGGSGGGGSGGGTGGSNGGGNGGSTGGGLTGGYTGGGVTGNGTNNGWPGGGHGENYGSGTHIAADGAVYSDIWNETNAPPHRASGERGRYNVVFMDGSAKSMESMLFQNHARYMAHPPPRSIQPPIGQNHFAF